ncbi:MAG: murein L,D-transpeptidase catalytic domain family protein [Flavobacteriales bacterium]|nr:murein L,D-transpeptidase catalytic domain family protein [Flavobacteriales bacterium]
MKTFAIALMVIFLRITVCAQSAVTAPYNYSNGNVVTLAGERLSGFINYRHYGYVKFKNKNGGRSKYSPNDIVVFVDTDANRRLVSVHSSANNISYFLHEIVRGEFPLYFSYEFMTSEYHNNIVKGETRQAKFRDEYANAVNGELLIHYDSLNASPFLFSFGDDLIEIPSHNEKFKEVMSKYFIDDASLIERIRNDELGFDDLIEIFEILKVAHPVPEDKMTVEENINLQAGKSKFQEAKEYVNASIYNKDFCIMIDMSIHSGKNRMFVYDFEKDSIIKAGLCSHGCGDNTWGGDETKTSPSFSNAIDSHRSSLGKFLIGERGASEWGINIHYLLHGLDSTNSNALIRSVVLHSRDNVRDYEIYPQGTAEGLGCPVVSNQFMTYLDSILERRKKPTLFWIYN